MIRYERGTTGEVTAVCEVPVGIERRSFRVPVGTWDDEPPPATGLQEAPVVILRDHGRTEVVRRAVLRAAGIEAPVVTPDGRGLLRAAQLGTEVMIVTDGNGRTMNVIRALGGRPLPALPASSSAPIAELFDGCHVEVDIAVPRLDEPARTTLRDLLAPLHLDDVHHVVEVDPRPGTDPDAIGDPDLEELAAAAAGVLAGRLAAGSRRWQAR